VKYVRAGIRCAYADFQILWPIKKAESLSALRFVFFLASDEETPSPIEDSAKKPRQTGQHTPPHPN